MARKDSQMLDNNNADHDVNIYKYKTTVHNDQYTYLNSGLLMTPREYVLHGFVLGID
jgi:hypothetical protein